MSTQQLACSRCGVTRSTVDRFCSSCGLNFRQTAQHAGAPAMSPSTAAAASGKTSPPPVDLVDLQTPGHIETTQIEGGGARTLRIVLTGAALVIAGIIGVSLLTGADDADTIAEAAATSTDADDNDADAATESTDAGEPAQTSDDDRDLDAEQVSPDSASSSSDAGSAGDTDATSNTPGNTETPDDTDEAPEDVEAVEEDATPEIAALNLTGYLVQSNGRGVDVLDLATGELVENLFPYDLRGAHVTDAGLICCFPSYSSDSQDFLEWSLFPWDGSGPVALPISPTDQVRGTVTDPDVGPLVIVSEEDAASPLNFAEGAAIRVDTGERKPIPLDDSLPLAIPALWQSPNPGDNLRLGSGNAIFEWHWEDGWTKVSAGDLVASAGRHYIADTCTSPTSCERYLYTSGGGEPVSTVPTSLFLYPTVPTRLSPDQEWLVVESFTETGPAAELVNLEFGTRELLPLGSNNYGVSLPGTWVGDDHLAIVGPDRSYVLHNVNTGEQWAIPELQRSTSLNSDFTRNLTWIPDVNALVDAAG